MLRTMRAILQYDWAITPCIHAIHLLPFVNIKDVVIATITWDSARQYRCEHPS